MSKKVLLLSIMISLFLISMINADISTEIFISSSNYSSSSSNSYSYSLSSSGCDLEGCDDDYYSDKYCDNGDVYMDFHDFFYEGSCWNKECKEEITFKLVEECDYDCVEGECIDEPEPPVEPECYVDLDCGIDYCLGGPNYCLNNDVYQDFKIYTCNNPGQGDAYCSDDEAPWLLEECDYDCVEGECIDEPEPPVNICGDDNLNIGVEECDDGNLIDGDGCSSICEIEEPEPPEPCDDDYYEDKYCDGGDVYRDFHSFNYIDDMCVENILEELLDECDSDETCENGKCVEDEDDDDDDDHDSTCNDRELYNNCRLREVEDVLVVYDALENEVEVINDINVIGQSQEKIIDNSWILYLFIGVCALIVLILIVLGVRG